MCVIPGSERDAEAHRRIDDLTEAMRVEGPHPRWLFLRGHAHKQVGHLTAALDDLARVALDPATDPVTLGRAHHYLGVCHRRLGNLDAALAAADRAVEAEPDNGSVIGHRGYIRSMLGEHTAALEDYAEALRLAPHLGVTYAFRANGWFWQGEYAMALEDFDHLIDEYHDELLFKAFHDRAATKVMLGDLDGALTDLETAERLRPDDPWYPRDPRPLALRGWVHLERGELDAADADLHESSHLGPAAVGIVAWALLEARRGRYADLAELGTVLLGAHDGGAAAGATTFVTLLEDPGALLPMLQPLIG